MSFEYEQRLPSPEEVLVAQPLAPDLAALKRDRDAEVARILRGEDDRLLLLIGPCSAHREDPVCEYVGRLARLQEEVRERVVLVPRIYTNKPRTLGTGYKGMLHQPDPQEVPDVVKGLQTLRHLHLRALAESHLPAADEMLYPGNYPYLADVLAYVAVGARSVENQQHRLTASGFDVPAGMKNPVAGDLKTMLDSVHAAQSRHVFIYNGWEVSTTGNPLAHAILRGAVNQHGNSLPNYHYEDLLRLAEMCAERELANPAVIVDTNHANSGKQYREQGRIAKEVMGSRAHAAPDCPESCS